MKKPLRAVNDKEPFVLPTVLARADQLRQDRNYEEALRLAVDFMNDHFDYVPAMILAAHIFIDTGRIGLAHAIMQRASVLAPDLPVVWNNLGIVNDEAQDLDEAERCFIKALNRDPNDELALSNLAHVYLRKGEPKKSLNCSEKAFGLNPKIPEVKFNIGQAKLMLREWKEGWEGYEHNLGKHRGRKERLFGNIPRWTGHNGLTVVAYGEQGIGDEISFASCIPDLMRENNVIIECDHRLQKLFQRSFDVPVYGTRYLKGAVEWPLQHDIDATVAFGSLPGFYRNSDESFPGTPYLVADPERRLQWKALLASLGPKKKVGIAWSGGIKKTGKEARSIDIEEMLPILRQDAIFISLQYRSAPELLEIYEKYGIVVHHWPHATETDDYDDTAALVAELDLVISVQTSIVHTAGALGTPCWALLPKAPLWRYGVEGSDFPWAKSVKLYRQHGAWINSISEVATDLRNYFK
jgi:hypothetical protein